MQTETDKSSQLSDRGYELALANYGHIEQQASLSVTKAALLVAAHAILGAVYVSFVRDYGVLRLFEWQSAEPIAFFLAAVALAAGFILSLYAIFPKSRPDERGDVLFFVGINEFSNPGAYVQAYREKDRHGLEDELLKNIYGKSCWLRRNFHLLRGAIYCSIAATFLVLLGLMIMGVSKG